MSCPQHQAPDAPEAIDPDPQGHRSLPSSRWTRATTPTRVAVLRRLGGTIAGRPAVGRRAAASAKPLWLIGLWRKARGLCRMARHEVKSTKGSTAIPARPYSVL